MNEPRWLTDARLCIGEREITGRKHNPKILQWWTLIRAPFTDDETPWCAGFVGGILEKVGIKSTRSAWARSYTNYGQKLRRPIVGCIVVFERGPTSGHVGFYVGKTAGGYLLILDGNQGDMVKISPFPQGRVLSYRWPPGEPITGDEGQTIVNTDQLSKNEA